VFLSAPSVGLVFTDLEVVDENLHPLGYRAWQGEWVEFGEKEHTFFRRGKALNVLLTRNVVTGCAMAFRSPLRELVLPIQFINEWTIHDRWIALMVAAVADLAFIREPLVKYRKHSNQQMGILPPPINASTQAAKERRLRMLHADNNLLKPICERLTSVSNTTYKASLSEIKARTAHAEVRSNLHAKRFPHRALCVLKGLLTFRYHRFRHPDSNSFYDAAKDIMPYKFLSLSSFITSLLARTHETRDQNKN
jgi:hypothetical protein